MGRVGDGLKTSRGLKKMYIFLLIKIGHKLISSKTESKKKLIFKNLRMLNLQYGNLEKFPKNSTI